MVFQGAFLPIMGDGMEVEIDMLPFQIALIEQSTDPVSEKGHTEAMRVTVGILGDGGCFGQDIQTGKEPDPEIKTQIVNMGKPFFTQKFQDQVTQWIRNFRNMGRAIKTTLLKKPIQTRVDRLRG